MNSTPGDAAATDLRGKLDMPKELALDLGGGVKMEFVLVPAGEFMMGSPEGEGDPNEHPQVRVTINEAFWLFDTPVTQALWQATMGNNPSQFEGRNRPVENVSWDDADKFAKALNRRLPGLEVGLPSEAQWEYACRAGTVAERLRREGDLETMGVELLAIEE